MSYYFLCSPVSLDFIRQLPTTHSKLLIGWEPVFLVRTAVVTGRWFYLLIVLNYDLLIIRLMLEIETYFCQCPHILTVVLLDFTLLC